MSKSAAYENDILRLLFNGDAIAGIADNAAAPATDLYLALHTADVGEAGDQSTNETAYTGYSRIALVRTSAGWTVTGSSVSPTANVEFGECTALPGDPITHISIGAAASGAGKVYYYGALSPQIAVAIGVIPRLTTNSTIAEE